MHLQGKKCMKAILITVIGGCFSAQTMERQERSLMMQRIRYTAVFSVFFILIAQALFAGDPATPSSENKWIPLIEAADGGDVEAQYALAVVYEKGRGDIPKNLVQARKWYERAAEQGHTNSQNKLAVMYYHGMGGLQQDIKKAMALMERSAEKNNDGALMMLGQIYYNGDKGITIDRWKAAEYFEKSARLGNRIAQDYLGVMYYNGEGGLKQDKQKARLWYEQSAARDYDLAKIHLATMIYHGEGGLEADQDKAVAMLDELAKKGHAGAFQILERWSGGETTERTITIPLKKGEGKARYPWDMKDQDASEQKTP